MRSISAIILLFTSIFLPLSAYSDTCWVSPTGTSSWKVSISNLPLSGTACTSIKTANDSANAGDVIIMRGGVYNTGIIPVRSGTGVSEMIIYQAHTNEVPIITGSNNSMFFGIFLNDKHYIKIDGVKIQDVDRWMNIRAGSSHIEIANCVFTETDGKNVAGINIWGQCNGGMAFDCPVTDIWFHNNKVFNRGWVNENCDDAGALMYVGSTSEGDSNSNNITIEDNVFYWGGHHLLETYTKHNVLRGNYFHNEGFMKSPEGITCSRVPDENGLYGNRCIQIYDGHNQDGLFNLIEGNRFGKTGCPPDDNGGNSFKLVSRKNIARYNQIFNSAGAGLYFKQGYLASSDSNVVYNNTIYKTGQATAQRTDMLRFGIAIHSHSLGNKIKNNIIYDSPKQAIAVIGTGSITNSTVEGNWTWSDGDPLFRNTEIPDPFNDTLPNLKLSSGSPCIGRAVHLTNATIPGTNSTVLPVECALYFQDGTWGSSLADLQADWIAVGTAANRAQIISINYATNTIKLAKPLSWFKGAKVWLFRDSAGRIVLRGVAPDIGAYEN